MFHFRNYMNDKFDYEVSIFKEEEFHRCKKKIFQHTQTFIFVLLCFFFHSHFSTCILDKNDTIFFSSLIYRKKISLVFVLSKEHTHLHCVALSSSSHVAYSVYKLLRQLYSQLFYIFFSMSSRWKSIVGTYMK